MLSLSLILACAGDGKVDTPSSVEDSDSDGYTIGEGDCNDQDPHAPSAPDMFGDAIDQNCDGADRSMAMVMDAGVATGGTDCDDSDPALRCR